MTHENEIEAGQRFAFGENWRRFLEVLDERRIQVAERSLQVMLEVDTLAGQRFLDIGSGSGLFSLAARRLGARVHSFDYDPQSVACTAELRTRHFAADPDWLVEGGSVLDESYLGTLGTFDLVYCWGVVHHTGAMWKAIRNVAPVVSEGGRLFIAIYDDQGEKTKFWKWIKRTYNKLPHWARLPYALIVMIPRECRSLVRHVVDNRTREYFSDKRHYAETSRRGMSWWHDQIDWIGGYPFEVARPEEVIAFLGREGFELTRLKTCGGACNEYLFVQGKQSAIGKGVPAVLEPATSVSASAASAAAGREMEQTGPHG